jgi:hypothetical protein
MQMWHISNFDVIGKLHQPVHFVFSNVDTIPNLDQVVNVVFKMSGSSL